MKITKLYNTNTNFYGGLTKQMLSEIRSTNPYQVSQVFSQHKVMTDFKNNKMIAWCCYKCLEIIKNLNKNLKLNFALPNGIFVEDFNTINRNGGYGFVNVLPTTNLYPDKRLIPEKTIFYNQFKTSNNDFDNKVWENLNEISDKEYVNKHLTTNFFLEIILHEFAHVIHENHLLDKLSIDYFLDLIKKTSSENYLQNFRFQFKDLIDNNLCEYATYSPFETVACDLTNRLITDINPNTLIPQGEIMKKSPYYKKHFLNILFEKKYDTKIRNFWNGKMN